MTHLSLSLRLARWSLARLVHFLFRVRVQGLENVPSGSYLVVANHLPWIDPFLLFVLLPAEPRLFFIGAEQAVNRRWKKWMMQRCNVMIPFERGARWVGRDAFAGSLQILRGGARLVLFPEGNLGTQEGKLMPLQRGVGHFALYAHVPILPVALSGVKELYWQKEIIVTIDKPFCVNVQELKHRAAIDAAVKRVTNELGAVLPPYREPPNAKKRWRFLNDLLG